MRTQGKITYWNEEKGYGFITPAAGAKQVFLHIRAFSNRRKTPGLNQIVTFSLSTDEQGRPGALIAQETLRHKTRKEGFRALFWVTVVVNCGVFVWFFTSDGTEWLRALIAA